MPPPSVSRGSGMDQTVTIINNSGKIVNTGKQLVSLFSAVSTTYKDKKAELKLRRFLQRSAQDEPAPNVPRTRGYEPSVGSRGDGTHRHEDDGAAEYRLEDGRRSRHAYDEQSVASSRRSHTSRQSTRSDQHRRKSTGKGLTESNLDRMSETSSTAPSRAAAPGAYRSPYAETIQPGAATRGRATEYERSITPSECTQAASESLGMRGGLALQQRQQIQQQQIEEEEESSVSSDDDMHLAYGSLPPDLAQRKDLDPVETVDQVEQAQSLVHRIEDLLDEVECMEHTATEMIKHLQERPDAAAAVALTLAELSAFVGKMSPAFLNVLKGGSPAVFALLASPQFLIGTSIAVGVTVVMFGGWKIIQRATSQQEQRQALAFEASPAPAAAQPASQVTNEAEEALVLKRVEEEMSTIDTWRRGIVADSNWEKETAEMELITPKAKTRRTWGRDRGDDDETKSHRSSATHKSSRPSDSHKSKPSHREDHHHKQQQQQHPSSADRRSSRRGDEGASVASSGANKRSSSTKKPKEQRDHRDDRSTRGGSSKTEEAPAKAKETLPKAVGKATTKMKGWLKIGDKEK
ncbi:hypothetical protein ESCO_001670 [Escovopsis weberi]|uniref:Uncharacterized protein n=1 Tax=Escovopsis weberi TaxID=150374 RepID=A0A0M8N2U0_ESCWE|nr:hypothetical protein ESCO_001670 [Escovopsis weberi]